MLNFCVFVGVCSTFAFPWHFLELECDSFCENCWSRGKTVLGPAAAEEERNRTKESKKNDRRVFEPAVPLVNVFLQKSLVYVLNYGAIF